MKKLWNLALLGAIALSGAVSFSACSSNDEIVDNPDYNPATQTVKTTIALNIDPNNGANTRQTSMVTQASGNFRGMQNLYLYTATSSTPIDKATTLSACIQLDAIQSEELANQSNKLYTDKEIKVGTNNFLFYGKAFTASNSSKSEYGYTTSTLATTITSPSSITFSPQSIVAKSGESYSLDWVNAVNSLTEYLNGIANATGWATSTNPQLQFAYQHFTKAGPYRAGSANGVLATAQELYKTVYPFTQSTDAASKSAADNLISAIVASTYVSTEGEGLNLTLSWVSSFDTSFPTSLGMPEGAAQYHWNTETSKFEYLTAPVLDASNVTELENYIYPNEIYYFTNTPLRATANTAIWPTTVNDWRLNPWTNWVNSVESSSKNIALFNNIQYGSALLATQVKCTPLSIELDGKTTDVLYDNAKALVDGAEENNPIPYKDDAFPLTGVIVGGQPASVGWDFLPETAESFKKVIYDGVMSYEIYAKNTNTEYSSPNYTVVFDNLNSSPSATTQNDVNICLEFTNNTGFDFYGKDGLILKGQKFYLIATLKVSEGTGSLDFTEAATYFPSTDKRIFIQDFMTTARINLTAGSATEGGALGDAVSTIPDLRTSSQSLGLSVDLNWKPGLTFKKDI